MAVRRAVLVLALVVIGTALVFPFAPVMQPEVRYTWSATEGAAAIPLMPYQPVDLRMTASCAAARSITTRVVLSTVPLHADPIALPLYGLLLTTTGDRMQVLSAGTELGYVALPPGACTVSIVSDPGHTSVTVDGVEVLGRNGDVRPDVAGAFSEITGPPAADVRLELTADTRFQTSITPLKAIDGAVCVVALLGLLLMLGRADRLAGAPAVRLLPRGWWRPRVVDVAVGALLACWWLVGSITVDDGYIAGIVRSADENGVIGNVYRWLNAPEAPFSWIYVLYDGWSRVSASTLWMRLPSTLLGVACWVLLSRLVLPRLGPATRLRGAGWLAALAFGTWWIPFNLGLRPDPWIAVGVLAVVVAVERAVATRRVRPLAVGLLLAGIGTAVTPGGLMTFAPVVAAAPPLARLLRTRRDLHRLPLLGALVAAPAVAVVLMAADQSAAGLLEAVRVRQVIGGGAPWYAEYERYAALLEPDSFQGSIGRRAAVLGTLLALVAVVVMLRNRPGHAGLAAGPGRRLVITLLLGLAVLTFTPTKWSQHFGDLAGLGAAVLALGLMVWTTAPDPRPARAGVDRQIVGLGALTVVASLVLAGYNRWPSVSGWFTPSYSTKPPELVGIPLATAALVLGGGLVAVLLARSTWLRAGCTTEVPVPRLLPGPAPLLAVLLAAVLLLQVGSLARVAVTHRDSYTLAADGIATLRGGPCGLQRVLSVELDPAAGLLPASPGRPTTATVPVPIDTSGRTLPGIAIAGRQFSPWFTLDEAQRSGRLPVVLTLAGAMRPANLVLLEFGDAAGGVLASRRVDPGAAIDEPHDSRQLAPTSATAVRLVVSAPDPGRSAQATVSLPRVPRLTPLLDVVPPGSTAVLDWPVAFYFPCLIPPALPLGTAVVPGWRIAPPAASEDAGITYDPQFGGPFAGPRLLVGEQRMATFLAGDPIKDAVQLRRWTPLEPLSHPQPVVRERQVAGWSATGHARVPGRDPIG